MLAISRAMVDENRPQSRASIVSSAILMEASPRVRVRLSGVVVARDGQDRPVEELAVAEVALVIAEGGAWRRPRLDPVLRPAVRREYGGRGRRGRGRRAGFAVGHAGASPSGEQQCRYQGRGDHRAVHAVVEVPVSPEPVQPGHGWLPSKRAGC